MGLSAKRVWVIVFAKAMAAFTCARMAGLELDGRVPDAEAITDALVDRVDQVLTVGGRLIFRNHNVAAECHLLRCQ